MSEEYLVKEIRNFFSDKSALQDLLWAHKAFLFEGNDLFIQRIINGHSDESETITWINNKKQEQIDFLQHILPKNWNLYLKPDAFKSKRGTLNIRLHLLKYDDCPSQYSDFKGWVPSIMIFYKGVAFIPLFICIPILSFKDTMIHEFAHIAENRLSAWRSRVDKEYGFYLRPNLLPSSKFTHTRTFYKRHRLLKERARRYRQKLLNNMPKIEWKAHPERIIKYNRWQYILYNRNDRQGIFNKYKRGKTTSKGNFIKSVAEKYFSDKKYLVERSFFLIRNRKRSDQMKGVKIVCDIIGPDRINKFVAEVEKAFGKNGSAVDAPTFFVYKRDSKRYFFAEVKEKNNISEKQQILFSLIERYLAPVCVALVIGR